VTVALVTESLGVTIGYFIYQAKLKDSRNKYSVDVNGIPFKLEEKIIDKLEDNENDDN